MNSKSRSMVIFLTTGSACILNDDKSINERTVEDPSDSSVVSDSSDEASYAYITQSYSGSAIVVPNASYEGIEVLSLGVNDTIGTGNLSTELVWNIVGVSTDDPVDCGDCIFAFDLDLTFDAAASTDPNGDGKDAAFSYALGTSSYGENILFYGSYGEWNAWLVVGNSQVDLTDTEHETVVSFDGRNFTYSDGTVDFYYYY
jgi:hypothetical protein